MSNRKKSARERLLGKKRLSITYRVRVDDTEEAERALEEARSAYRQALIAADSEDDAPVRNAKRRRDRAREALEACYEPLTINALRPADLEKLLGEHPAQDEDGSDALWHTATFRPALLAACVDSDMTADDWAVFCEENLGRGERDDLWLTVLDVNHRAPDSTIPKD